jgi:hypothetical protein
MTTPHRTLDLAALRVDVPWSVIRLRASSSFACAIGKSASMRSTNRDRLTGSELLGYPARHEASEQAVQPMHRLGAQSAEIVVAAPRLASPWSGPRRPARAGSGRAAATATERASLSSFLLICPVSSSRTRAPRFGRHVQDAPSIA